MDARAYARGEGAGVVINLDDYTDAERAALSRVRAKIGRAILNTVEKGATCRIECTESPATVFARFLRERGQAIPPEVTSVLAKLEAVLPVN
jgi:hypothetical protein